MLYGEYKKTSEYLNAEAITLCINGTDEIDGMNYPDELDNLEVVGVGYSANGLFIDLVCANWDKRFDVGWVGENIKSLTTNENRSYTTNEIWEIVCNTVKEGVCSTDELDGIINLAQNIFDFDVEDRLISEGVVSSDIRYRHYSADDL